MIDTIKNQLKIMDIKCDEINSIRSKDGVHLYKINNGNNRYVLKYFENAEFKREIKNYLILQKLDILTIPLIAYTEESILIEDISNSADMRLAAEEDMNDLGICESLGRWYKNLHEKGKEYVKIHGNSMYMEADCITYENIQIIKQKTNTANNQVWRHIEKNLDLLKELINNTEKTLTYNDFYYANMAVSKKYGAFMFDYNLLGKGYIASDIKNVTLQLGEEAKKTFFESYGKYNEKQTLMHEVVGTLVGLYFACGREVFPKWAYEELEAVKNGEILRNFKMLF